MNIFDSNNIGLNEIVFENRNKEYGAYEIRQTDAQRHWYSFFIGVSIYLLVLISFYYWLNLKDGNSVSKNKLNDIIFDRGNGGFAFLCKIEKVPVYKIDYEKIHFHKKIIITLAFPPPKIESSLKPDFFKILYTSSNKKKFAVLRKQDKLDNFLISYYDINFSNITEKGIFEPKEDSLHKFNVSYYNSQKGNRTPRFNNDMQGIEDFMKENFQYPQEAFLNCIEAKVFVQFILETDGSFSNIKLLNKTGFGCDEEALRLIKLMPRWSPAYKKGKKVQSKITIPIIFKIE